MRHFLYKTLPDLQADAERINARQVRFQADPERIKAAVARPVQVGSFIVGNSLCIHPMEGCDGELDGRPGDLTRRRYERFGSGGAKLLWFEATAVTPEGRANPRQLAIDSNTVGSLARMLERTREVHRQAHGTADDLLDTLQLTHSGRFSVPHRVIAQHCAPVDAKFNVPADYPVITDDELERLEDAYVEGARLALQAGFRAVDVKATHGYLLAELLDAKGRPGKYGGSLENRTRFLCNVLGKIRAAFGSRLLLTMRLGCFESVPYATDPATGYGVPLPYDTPYEFGFGTDAQDPLQDDLAEVKQAIGLFRDAGLALLNVSIGCPYYNPHIGRPFEKPDEGNYEAPEHPLLGVDRHFRIAGELQRSFPDLPMVGSGYSWLQTYAGAAAAANIEDGNIRFFGYGRGALAYPDFAEALLSRGTLDPERVCRTVTFCTYLMRQKDHPMGQWPTGCPPYDKEVYGPLIKEVRAAKRVAAKS